MSKQLAAGVTKAEEKQLHADQEFADTHGANTLVNLHKLTHSSTRTKASED